MAMKKKIGPKIPLYHPDFCEIIIVHNDATKNHLGGGEFVIIGNHKINPAQNIYTNTEQ